MISDVSDIHIWGPTEVITANLQIQEPEENGSRSMVIKILTAILLKNTLLSLEYFFIFQYGHCFLILLVRVWASIPHHLGPVMADNSWGSALQLFCGQENHVALHSNDSDAREYVGLYGKVPR